MISAESRNESIPKGIIIPYRVISIAIALIALLTLIISTTGPLFSFKAWILISQIVIEVILVYGFWNMRKWIVVVMGSMIFFLFLDYIAKLSYGNLPIRSAVVSLLIMGTFFIFSYFTKNYLNGEYRNFRVLRVFFGALLLSQILIIFNL